MEEVWHMKESIDHDPPKNLADLALEFFGPKHGIDEFPPIPRLEFGEPPDFSLKDSDPE